MILDQGIAAVIAAVIVTAVAFFAGIITAKQKNDELLLLAIKHLCGGSQERNVGISAVELYWDKDRHRDLCVSMIVGSAIYLLRESKQEDAKHELYNLDRIMDFLLSRKKLISKKNTIHVYYKHLDSAINDANSEVDAKKEARKKRDTDQKYKVASGLWIEKEKLDSWLTELK